MQGNAKRQHDVVRNGYTRWGRKQLTESISAGHYSSYQAVISDRIRSSFLLSDSDLAPIV